MDQGLCITKSSHHHQTTLLLSCETYWFFLHSPDLEPEESSTHKYWSPFIYERHYGKKYICIFNGLSCVCGGGSFVVKKLLSQLGRKLKKKKNTHTEGNIKWPENAIYKLSHWAPWWPFEEVLLLFLFYKEGNVGLYTVRNPQDLLSQ